MTSIDSPHGHKETKMKCAKCGFETATNSDKSCPNCGASTTGVCAEGALRNIEIASPWWRWSARVFDLWLGYFMVTVLIFIVYVMCALFAPNLVTGDSERITSIIILLSIPLAMCLEGLEYWAFGGTFGKWVFSIRVLDSKGEKISAAEYWKRLVSVWVSGLGLGIPLVALITQLIQYRRLKKGKCASYDEKAGRTVLQYKQSFVKWVVFIVFALAAIAMYSLLTRLGEIDASPQP